MVLMLMVTSVYSIVDGWFISNYAGSTAFASMNIIWPAIMLIGALGLPALLGPNGIWLAVDAADFCCMLLGVSLILAYRKRYGY